jgi:hypothetical protein
MAVGTEAHTSLPPFSFAAFALAAIHAARHSRWLPATRADLQPRSDVPTPLGSTAQPISFLRCRDYHLSSTASCRPGSTGRTDETCRVSARSTPTSRNVRSPTRHSMRVLAEPDFDAPSTPRRHGPPETCSGEGRRRNRSRVGQHDPEFDRQIGMSSNELAQTV